jgi:hypothetical protein
MMRPDERERFARARTPALPGIDTAAEVVAADAGALRLALDEPAPWSCAGAGALPAGAPERRAIGGPRGRCAHCGALVILNGDQPATVAEHRDTRSASA